MAGRIPDAFIDELVARSDIVEIINARLPLKKAGREYKACCPFHSEKSPSFWVSPDKQFYHCFGCGAHGTVIGFLMNYEKLEFLEAVADLADRAGLEIPRDAVGRVEAGSVDLHELMAQAARFFSQTLADTPRARDYAARRGLDAAVCAHFALGYAPDAWDGLLVRFGGHDEGRRRLIQTGLIVARNGPADAPASGAAGYYDRFRDRLMFPIRDSRGRTIGFGGRILDQGEPKYLNSPETALFHKGRELYGLYEARQAHSRLKRLLIVEGYMDVVRLHQAGIRYAVATLGTATTPEHLNKAFRLTSEVVFCFDGDRAGRQAAWRALENSLPLASDGRELKFLFLPEGHDPDTLVGEEGAAAFEARLQHAVPLSEYLVRQLCSEVDLGHDEGRAKLKALAEPLFARLPEGLYREMLADRLARSVGVPAAVLKQAFRASRSAGVTQRPPSPEEPSMPPRSLKGIGAPSRRQRHSAGRGNVLSQAIGLVLHHPVAAQSVVDPQRLLGLEKRGVDVLHQLLQQAMAMQQPTTAMLLERWRDRPESARLVELASAEPTVADAQGAAQELVMAVEKLMEEFGPGKRMDELLRKAEEIGLNSDEKAELRRLLKAKSRPRGAT